MKDTPNYTISAAKLEAVMEFTDALADDTDILDLIGPEAKKVLRRRSHATMDHLFDDPEDL